MSPLSWFLSNNAIVSAAAKFGMQKRSREWKAGGLRVASIPIAPAWCASCADMMGTSFSAGQTRCACGWSLIVPSLTRPERNTKWKTVGCVERAWWIRKIYFQNVISLSVWLSNATKKSNANQNEVWNLYEYINMNESGECAKWVFASLLKRSLIPSTENALHKCGNKIALIL